MSVQSALEQLATSHTQNTRPSQDILDNGAHTPKQYFPQALKMGDDDRDEFSHQCAPSEKNIELATERLRLTFSSLCNIMMMRFLEVFDWVAHLYDQIEFPIMSVT
jgi:hypothetical protein